MRPFEPFAAGRRVAVAVSGGADSTALAVLLSRWGRPEALIVDHGLRSEAAIEARLAAEQLARVGVPSRVLHLTLPHGPAASERARTARYAALALACAETGLVDLLVGHHAQDQVETSLLRDAMGSGPAGLAGMASVVHYADVRLLRPLLNVMPDRLRATLHEAGVRWSEDPGNHDLSRPRAVLRERFRETGAGYVVAHKVRADQAGFQRHHAESAALADLGGKVTIYPEGFAHVTEDVSAEAFSALLWMLSGRPHPPSPASVGRRMCPIRPGTLHGLVVTSAGRFGAGWVIAREAAGAGVPAMDGAMWDGRFRLHGRVPPGTTISALGQVPGIRKFSDLPSIVLRTLPALRLKDIVIAVPHLGYPDQEHCRGLSFSFEPGRPAGPAAFVRV